MNAENANTQQSPILNETDKKIIRYTAYTLGGLILAGGAGLGIYKLSRTILHNSAIDKAMGTSPEHTYAARLELAFENDQWPGTDEALIRQVLLEIPDLRMWEKVKKAYKVLTGDQLVDKLQDELASTEWEEMRLILSIKPDSANSSNAPNMNDLLVNWSQRLYAAFNYQYMSWVPGTDTEAVKSVLEEVPSKAIWERLKQTYFTENSESLEDRLNEELEIWEFDWEDVIDQKPEE